MPDLKLPQLPDRTPVKLTITLSPDLSLRLSDYAQAYQETYGRSEPVVDLIPFILRAFLDEDRNFARRRPPQSSRP